MAKPFRVQDMTEGERMFLTKDTPLRHMLMDHEDLKKKISLGHDLQKRSSPKFDTVQMGDLYKYLPTELMIAIFHLLPIKALVCLARTNSRSISIIDNWKPWANLKQYATNVIRALLATPTDTPWTVSHIEHVVYAQDCEICGELGEVVYLPKLIRCCIKCLASDRRVLALEFLDSGSLSAYTKLNKTKLPLFKTVPQARFFGQMLPETWCIDHIEALRFKETTGISIIQRNDLATPRLDSNFFEAEPDYCLNSKCRSVQPQWKSIQDKRQKTSGAHLSTLSLPTEITDIPESSTLQFACSVYQHPIKTVPISKESHKIARISLSGKYCAGCAYFWNYHSPLPFQYHTRYLSRGARDIEGPLYKHISTCIYARMYWNKLYPRGQRVNASRAIMIMENIRHGEVHFPRHGELSPLSDMLAFEQIPPICKLVYWENLDRQQFFQPELEWKVLEKQDENQNEVKDDQPQDQDKVTDHYYDMLLSSDAISQAGWACSSTKNYRNLFNGPMRLVYDRRDRDEERAKRKQKENGYKGQITPWMVSFDRL